MPVHGLSFFLRASSWMARHEASKQEGEAGAPPYSRPIVQKGLVKGRTSPSSTAGVMSDGHS